MIKIIGIAIIGAIIITYLKTVNSELTVPALVCVGVIVLGFSVRYLSDTVNFFIELKSLTGIDNEILVIIVKITSIGYLTEFAAGTIEDMGLKGLADKLIFVGKIIILSVSIPILYSVVNVIKVMLQ
ncbi:MAG: SpoIIIAC/SpoIIIAD family protein [Clostridia bacterium]|nr:SpoIIIAC/SpoIIIAD family protein [Clostridia bacterium]